MDGRTERRNKAAFLNFSGVVWTGSQSSFSNFSKLSYDNSLTSFRELLVEIYAPYSLTLNFNCLQEGNENDWPPLGIKIIHLH